MKHVSPLLIAIGYVMATSGACSDVASTVSSDDGLVPTDAEGDAGMSPTVPIDPDGGSPTQEGGGTPDADPTGPDADVAGPLQVRFETTLGDFIIELDPEAAPLTVENFLRYVDDGFFDGRDGLGQTVFHRVVPGFVIQGGGFTPDLREKTTRPPIVNEADNGVRNDRGRLSMARTSDPNSGTSQFFINLVDNDFLNFSPTFPGHAVFGRIAEGIEVVDAIAAVATANVGPLTDVPIEPVVTVSATVISGR